jgi:hypothetical protein
MVEAYVFFYERFSEFFVGTESEPPFARDQPLAARLEECFQALKSTLQVVAIDLEQGDDAQVIFETLNARGEPLLPADLLRNFIFLRAARLGEPQEALYDQYWRAFDDSFWRHPVRQGRLNRPRSDLFIQHFLASRQTMDIPIKHLFVEYKYWIEKEKPWPTVQAELAVLAKQGEDFRRMIEPQKGDILFPLVTFLDRFDIRTAYPLLLHLLDVGLTNDEWVATSAMLESYLLRRAVCGLTTKNLNRVFLSMTKTLRRDGTSPDSIKKFLSSLTGEAAAWPRDGEFSDAWQSKHAYQTLQNPKLVHILRRLSDTYASNKTEDISIDSPLTVEHILPQSWIEHWPLPDGSQGLTPPELDAADEEDPKAKATRHRHSVLQTLGNLTILRGELNASGSNSSWKDKKPKLLAASLLPINLQLHAAESWDESTIEQRGRELCGRAIKLWPGPAIAS